MKFIVIGINDNPQPWFPPEVIGIIQQGKVFSGGKRHHEIVATLLPKDACWIDITVPLDTVFEQYRQFTLLAPPTPIIVFASGDPLFFGFANTIRRKLPDAEMELYPSFNSLQMLAHKLVLPYHDMRIVSLTGRPWQEFDRALIERAAKIGILTDREHTPAAIAQRMLEYGYTCYDMSVGEHLGNPLQERITTLSLPEAAAGSYSMPNCVIVVHRSQSTPHRSFGLPDSSFVLLNGREKMITKMPIRLLTLQALDLTHRSVLWDIGFCTGSVSIEARLQFPHLRIEAFEIRPECEAIIHENARRHGTPGISIHIGDFLQATLPVGSPMDSPDAVFIGGHGGRLKEIMAIVKQHLAPGGLIVMNSVTADSKRLFEEACTELGLRQHAPLHIALNDYNPIHILKCELPL